jgi:hypothetical protein
MVQPGAGALGNLFAEDRSGIKHHDSNYYAPEFGESKPRQTP